MFERQRIRKWVRHTSQQEHQAVHQALVDIC